MLMLVTLLGWGAPANAQDGIDAHGFIAAPSDNELLDPLEVWRAEAGKPGYVGLNGLFEYASRPLVRYLPDSTDQALLDNVAVLNLAASVGFHERISATLNLPLVLTSHNYADGGAGPTLADARLAIPIALVYTDHDDQSGFHLSLIPFADLPTGSSARYLGSGGFAGGGIAAARIGGGTWDIDANLGVQTTPAITALDNLQGGAHLIVGGAIGIVATDWLGVRAEVNLRPPLKANAVAGTESPGEALLSFRGRYDGGLSWTLGGAAGIMPGAGAAAYRAFFGIGYTHGEPKDTDMDGLIDKLDACPTEPETVNSYKDDDGCPDQLAALKLKVVDPKGQPIEMADVKIGDQTYQTNIDGLVELDKLMPETALGAGDATADRFEDQPFAPITLKQGVNEATVMLLWKRTSLTVTAYTVEKGAKKPIDAVVTFKSRAQIDPVHLGLDGTETTELPSNASYTVYVNAEGFLPERRDIDATPGDNLLLDIDLKPAKAIIHGTQINILEQVKFDSGKAIVKPESFGLLDQIAQILNDNPQVKKVEVQGHTDDKGNDASNMKLSQARVDSVVKYLVEKGHVDASRLTPVGYGETKPMVPNTSDANRAQNRRVQFVITAQGE